MAYKDKDKQKQAVKEATRRYRAKNEDSALSGQKQVSQNARGLPVVDEVGDTLPVIPSVIPSIQPLTCRYCGLPLDEPSPQCARHSQGG